VSKKTSSKKLHFSKFKELSRKKPGPGHAFFEFVIFQQNLCGPVNGVSQKMEFFRFKKETH
jgi:hypothetical protein